MPRRIPIRLKLAAALAVPIVALLLVSVLEVAQSIDETRTTKDQNELATAAIGPGGLITGLQNERNYGSLYILGFENALQLPVTSFEEAVAETDAAIARFRAEVDEKGGEVAETYEPALDTIAERIDELRSLVTGLEGERSLERTDVSDPFFNGYTELIDELFRANSQVSLAIDDPTLRRGVELTDLASHQIENVARTQRVVLLAGVTGRLDSPQEIADTAGLLGQVRDNLDQTRDLGTGRFEAATTRVLEQFEQSGWLDLVEEALDTGEVRLTETLNALSREDDEGFNGYRTVVNELIHERAEELDRAAASTQRRYLILAALTIGVAGAVTWIVSRSITRPLRALTRQAKE
ncbi:MAG: nitrate- and nitrite sensing domain-containing protein, partial [Thermoanaerobacterales bacterium]